MTQTTCRAEPFERMSDGVHPPLDTWPAPLDPGVGPREKGAAVRRAVLGDAHVDGATAAASPLTEPFQDLITRYAWGDVCSRPGLDRRTRSLLTLALLTALGHEHELAMHVRAALTNGVPPQEVSEVLLHSAVYAGVSAANRACTVAQRVLEQEHALEQEQPGEQEDA